MRLYGLIDACYPEREAWNPATQGQPAWPDPYWLSPGYAATGNSLTWGYESYGLVAGMTDRFYVSSYTMDADNFAALGTLFQTVVFADLPLATVTATGLIPDQDYFVLGVRFNASEEVIATWLNHGKTLKQSIAVTPPLPELVADWSVDNFNSWFSLCQGADAARLSITPGTDVQMGSFVRLKGRQNPFYTATNGGNPRSGWVNQIVSKHSLSPRDDWEITIPVRVKQSVVSGQQFQFGFCSGDQQNVGVETMGCHTADFNFEEDSGAGMQAVDASRENFILWGTCQDNTVFGTAGGYETRQWRMGPEPIGDYTIADDTVTVFRFVYNAAAIGELRAHSVRVYKDDVLICTFGGTHAPPFQRLRDDRHYPHPVTIYINLQDLAHDDNVYLDIGEISMISACPFHYAGYVANPSPLKGSHGAPSDGYAVDFWDGALHTMHNLAYWTPQYVSNLYHRHATRVPAGFTLQPTDYTLHDIVSSGNHAYIPQTVSGKLLPVAVPASTVLRAFSFQGLPLHGTIQGRITDGAAAITDYVAMTDVYAIPLSYEQAEAVTIQPEVELTYDGSAISFSELSAAAPAGRPNTPPLFVGFEAYFGEPVVAGEFDRIGNIITAEDRHGNPITSAPRGQ